MNILGNLGVESITGLVKGAGQFAKDVRAAITGQEVLNPEDKFKLVQAANEMERAFVAADTQLQTAQVELNKIEAQGNWFQRGWRPFLGWICGLGFLYQFLVNPLLPWFVALFKAQVPKMEPLQADTLMALTFGMLGLASARTVEKVISKKGQK
jgi:hypothetical protein